MGSINRIVGILVLCLSLVGGWLLWGYQVYLQTPLKVGDVPVKYEVPPGASIRAIARDLATMGILQRPKYFELMARLSGKTKRVSLGEYHIRPGTTPSQLLQQLTSGKVIQYSITLVEGWNLTQVRAALDVHEALNKELTALSDAQLMEQLGFSDQHPEGLFFPDTYYFPRGMTDADFLRRSYQVRKRILQEEWDGRASGLPYRSPYEALIMASIVEKETSLPDERAKIAGVFVRRLKRNMRLQTDPTVIYGLGADFDGNIRRRDLKRDTPYNTYVRKGLPPTPIAMPGRDSIHAALNPAEGDELYFVATGDGSHKFSVTFEEHDRAVTKYQRNGRRRKN